MVSRKQNAFTLIEVLIALLIFTIIGIMVAVALRNVINNHQKLQQYDTALQQLEVSVTLLRRDINQAVERPIKDTDGQTLPALVADGNNRIALTRGGLSNPFNIAHRSHFQRVAYQFEDGTLERLTWPVLDRANTTSPTTEVLLRGISNPSIQLYTTSLKPYRFWPRKNEPPLPRMVKIAFMVKRFGRITLDIPIVSQGVHHAVLPVKKPKS